MSKTSLMALLFFLLTLFSLVGLTGCKREQKTSDLPISQWSFRDVPGITDDEIKAIEQLQKEMNSFLFGKLASTEAFVISGSEQDSGSVSGNGTATQTIGGFSILLSEWLSNLFGIPFEVQIVDILQYLKKVTGEETELDFLGDFSRREGLAGDFFITDPISTRWLINARLEGSQPLDEIAHSRPIRYAFPINHPFIGEVAAVLTPGTYEVVEVPSEDGGLDSLYQTLKRGEADAFVLDSPAELVLDNYKDIIIEDFQPVVFNSASMATRKPELEVIISVINKALKNGARNHLSSLYALGYEQYRKNKLWERLSEEEKEYIINNPVIPLAAHYWFYPISYYDDQRNIWSGASIDVLNEVELLTGLTFEVVNHKRAEYIELIDLLLTGKAYIKTPLHYEDRLQGLVVWPRYTYFRSRYALLSKRDFHNINSGDIPFSRIGLIDASPYSLAFKRWFPDAENARDFSTNTMAFDAVDRGEIDLIMGSPVLLSHITNYFAYSGYKANYIFNHEIIYNFGLNKDHAILASILDKALPIIDTDKIVNQWMTQTYDYQSLLLKARIPWLVGAVITLALIIVLLIIGNRINRNKTRSILMLDTAPLCSQLWNKGEMLDCNKVALRLYGFEDKEDFKHNFFKECFPKFQPDGQNSLEWNIMNADKAFEMGSGTFMITQQKRDGTPIPAEVTLTRVMHKGKILSITYTRDLSEIVKLEAEAKKAYYDSLTDIYNRRFFDENLEHLLKTLSRSSSLLSLMMIDIDFFKNYNDTYGHSAGDTCLKLVAGALSKNITRIDDFVARYGGEEFAVVLPNTDEQGACLIAEKLLQCIRDLNILHEKSDAASHVTISIGVITGKTEYLQAPTDYIKKADELLYFSKQTGRNKYSFGNM